LIWPVDPALLEGSKVRSFFTPSAIKPRRFPLHGCEYISRNEAGIHIEAFRHERNALVGAAPAIFPSLNRNRCSAARHAARRA